MWKKRWLCLVSAALLLLLPGCTAPSAAPASSGAPAAAGRSTVRSAVESDELPFQRPADDAPTAEIITSAGTIYIVLYPDKAPLAVQNFAALAAGGLYNGTSFYQTDSTRAIWGGQAGGSLWGHPFLTERSDKLRHYTGALCMAGGTDNHESAFYIVAAPPGIGDDVAAEMQAAGAREEVIDAYRQAGGLPGRDTRDTVFGQVYAGIDVVDAIAASPLDDNGAPREPVVIEQLLVRGFDEWAASQR